MTIKIGGYTLLVIVVLAYALTHTEGGLIWLGLILSVLLYSFSKEGK